MPPRVPGKKKITDSQPVSETVVQEAPAAAPAPEIVPHVGARDDDDREVGACDMPPVVEESAGDEALESEFLVEDQGGAPISLDVPEVDQIPKGHPLNESEAETWAAKLPPQLVEDLEELFHGRFIEVSEIPEEKKPE